MRGLPNPKTTGNSKTLTMPMTPQKVMAIHSRAARLLLKPMLLNAAKAVRMPIRMQKRTSTWVDLSSRGRFGSCAKT